MTKARHVLRVLLLALSLGSSAEAGPNDVVLLPTVTPKGSTASAVLARPDPEDEPSLARASMQLDAALREAAQDLGLNIDLTQRHDLSARGLSERGLIERAQDSWIVSPRIDADGNVLRLRIVAVPPGSRVALVSVETARSADVDVRALVMLRDLVQAGRPQPLSEKTAQPSPEPATAKPARSPGRAILAVNATALGGYIGFSLQRASGSTDARLAYPLAALGSGVGLGSSMIVADEWDISVGQAWFLTAGMWWPSLSGRLLAESFDVADSDRYVYTLVGTLSGLTAAAVPVALARIDEGDAALAHSGGAIGLMLGGLTQSIIEGKTDATPLRGMGVGSAVGVLAAGTLATKLQGIAPSRILLVDLSLALGALAGAAAASPALLVGDEQSTTRNRIWLSSITGFSLAGGAVGVWLTQREPDPDASGSRNSWTVTPYAGMLASGATFEQSAVGGGVHGVW